MGREKRTGIYKLTNLTNNMVYIGQAVNIAER
jgi:excinuclease UvrABC nuclease subunit